MSPVTTPTGDKYRVDRQSELKWNWIKAPWTANDTSYVQVRHQVDAVLLQKKLVVSELQRAERLAKQQPQSSLAQFRWAYLLLQAPYAGIKLSRNSSEVYGPVVVAMQQGSDDKSYQYARLRFLMLSKYQTISQCRYLGLRLLKHSPKDYQVKFYTTWALAHSLDKEERRTSLRLAQELVRDYPRKSASYAALGYVYQARLFLTGELSAADKGVAAAKKELSLLPANDDRRSAVKWLIQELPRVKAEYKKNGFVPPKDIVK